MYEFEVTNLNDIRSFGSIYQKRLGSTPLLLFNGDEWDREDLKTDKTTINFNILKTFFIDYFHGIQIKQLNILSMDNLIVITLNNNTIYIRNYFLKLNFTQSTVFYFIF